MNLAEQLREALRNAPVTRYRLWKLTGIDQAVLSRFLHGQGSLSLESASKLCEALNLVLQPREAKKPKQRRT